MKKICPNCGSEHTHCPECGKAFSHGEASHCDMPACKKVNAPLDCECGMVVEAHRRGVINFDCTLIPYKA